MGISRRASSAWGFAESAFQFSIVRLFTKSLARSEKCVLGRGKLKVVTLNSEPRIFLAFRAEGLATRASTSFCLASLSSLVSLIPDTLKRRLIVTRNEMDFLGIKPAQGCKGHAYKISAAAR